MISFLLLFSGSFAGDFLEKKELLCNTLSSQNTSLQPLVLPKSYRDIMIEKRGKSVLDWISSLSKGIGTSSVILLFYGNRDQRRPFRMQPAVYVHNPQQHVK